MQSGANHEYGAIFILCLRIGDILVALLSGWLAYALYLGSAHVWTPLYSYAFILVVLLVVIIFSYFSLYQSGPGLLFSKQLKKLFVAWSFVFIFLTIFAFITKTGAAYSRLWLGLWFGLGFIGLLLFRAGMKWILNFVLKKGLDSSRILLVGDAELSEELIRHFRTVPEAGISLLGFFSLQEKDRFCESENVPLLGHVKQLADFLSSHSVDHVWIVLPFSQGAALGNRSF
ncbi:MAG: hypothetical protein KZQ58_09400 [gamma proteobacterium symbiont of Bathyaustriella thionipta]|nr:hypothetical protein [gamma proteobacterium symbiont of Bathyaustriella thionipta]